MILRDWFVSSYTGSQGNCVEVKITTEAVYVRNTRHRDGAVLEFTHAEWDAFTVGAHDGEFDRPKAPNGA